jgi:hypothetical protein
MEDFDQRRRRDQERQQARGEDRGRDRDSWWRGERSHDDDRPRRAETGWLDYDRDVGGSDDRQGRREEQRYGQSTGGERSRFSPDWSREGAEARYSDDPYYSRNRELSRGPDEYSRRGRSENRQDDDWPYDRSNRQSRDVQGSRDDEQGSHYRGYYSRSTTPFSYPGGSGYLYSESVTLRGPYAGRGPKGYKRSDQQIIEEACQRLERDSEVDASEIEVTAEDGVIRLRGTVSDRRTKRRAEECVESVYGARDVMNELRVSAQGAEGSQGSQGSQASQSGRGSQQSGQGFQTQGSQVGQGSQAGQGSQSGQGSQTSTPGMRPGAGSSPGEQAGDDKRTPRH